MGIKKIRTLVVDDSLLFRETLARALGQDEYIEVVGTAIDAYSARDKIIELDPDILTLDIEMPKMNGIEFLKKLMAQYPVKVIVVSSQKDKMQEALSAGAIGFIEKPQYINNGNSQSFINALTLKIKTSIAIDINSLIYKNQSFKDINSVSQNAAKSIIAIGSSTGGTEALYNILKQMPENIPGTVIVQHIPAGFSNMFAERLDYSCKMKVKQAQNGDKVEQGKVLIAPGDMHMRIKKAGLDYFVECFNGDKVNGHRPSVDVLFNSVADNVGKKAIGIILTGMGYDGAKGLLRMKQKGAITIGQDEKSSVVYGMPKVAYDIGAVQKQCSLEKIPSVLYSYF